MSTEEQASFSSGNTENNNEREKDLTNPNSKEILNADDNKNISNFGSVTSNQINSSISRPSNNLISFMQLIANFEGEGEYSAKSFIGDVKDIADLAGWSERETLLVIKSKLSGRAKELLISDIEAKSTKDLNTFIKIFLEYFQKSVPVSLKLHQFSTCRQRPNESVREYISRIKNTSLQFLEGNNINSPDVSRMLDSARLSQFVAGISPKLQRQLLSRNATDFDEACKYAMLEEQNEALLKVHHQTNMVNYESSDYDVDDFKKKSNDRYDYNKSNCKFNPKRDTDFVRNKSFKQDSRNGFSKDSNIDGNNYRNKSNFTKNLIVCFICGKQGHMARNCYYNKSRCQNDKKYSNYGNCNDRNRGFNGNLNPNFRRGAQNYRRGNLSRKSSERKENVSAGDSLN